VTGTENGGRPAAFFDVDRTLIAGASILRMAGPLRRRGLITRRGQLRALFLQVGFSTRGGDTEWIERFSALVRPIVAGWDAQELRTIVEEEFDRHLHPTVYREALERIELHRKQGMPVYAVSATIVEIVEPMAQLLGLDGALGTELEIVDGKFTGEIKRGCHGPEKAAQLRDFAAANNIDLSKSVAYSDSISDEEFLKAVGRAWAVNPDKELRRLAVEQGWGVLSFVTRVKAPLHHHRALRVGLFASAMTLLTAAMLRRNRRR
jgi:HAD superfamily hydrolase (TIGR01490 family)